MEQEKIEHFALNTPIRRLRDKIRIVSYVLVARNIVLVTDKTAVLWLGAYGERGRAEIQKNTEEILEEIKLVKGSR